eukprot:GFUD01051261.1.p1 GENE.GFUD01051261.1~~GFUD01051261.1.p1  ORF type:complete len:112 (-),score=57.00 GFUD01051261.1:206-541(-)
MSMKTEVTRGVFDPRTYREVDPNNSARKRRSDWLAIPGKIHYVRERTVASEERELEEQARKEESKEDQQEKANDEIVPEAVKQSEPIFEKKEATEFWPRKKRSDITMSRYV